MEYKYNLDVTSYKNGQRTTLNSNEDGSEGIAHGSTVWKRFKEGCSLRMLHPQVLGGATGRGGERGPQLAGAGRGAGGAGSIRTVMRAWGLRDPLLLTFCPPAPAAAVVQAPVAHAGADGALLGVRHGLQLVPHPPGLPRVLPPL